MHSLYVLIEQVPVGIYIFHYIISFKLVDDLRWCVSVDIGDDEIEFVLTQVVTEPDAVLHPFHYMVGHSFYLILCRYTAALCGDLCGTSEQLGEAAQAECAGLEPA